MTEALIPSLREYRALYGLTAERVGRLRPEALVMHPGPMNRGVEIDAEAAEDRRSVITAQVANGVAVRQAVLYLLLGAGTDLVPEGSAPAAVDQAVRPAEPAAAGGARRG